MLKKAINKRIIIALCSLFTIMLIYITPSNIDYTIKDIDSTTKYVNNEIKTHAIYLLDQNNLLALTKVPVNNKDTNSLIKELLNYLIIDSNNSSNIPSGFKNILPDNTKIISTDYNDGLVKINFSKELLDINIDYEEKMIEAIVYTLTEIDGVDNIIIYVEDEILTILPKTKTTLPSTLNRKMGINKKYDFQSSKDITSVTTYYVSTFNDTEYYVPVTSFVNDEREKIKIIVDELTSAYSYNGTLMSYLNANTEINSVSVEDGIMEVIFNSYVFNDLDSKYILEEVIYSISLSIKDNYSVNEVVFIVDNEEIYKSVLKSIE